MTESSAPQPAAAADAAARANPAASGTDQRRRRAWIVFAGGLESFNVPIVYVLFAPYFTSRVAADSVRGQELLAFALTVSGLFAALLAPPLSLAAEHPGRRRALMTLMLVLNAAGACVFWIAAPGSPASVVLIVLVAYGVASASNDLLYVFYGSILPEIARPAILGRTSGIATALGWAIALVATALFLAAFVWRETPLLGLDAAAGEPARLSGPFAAALMLALCAPLLLLEAGRAPVRLKRSFKRWFDEEVRSLLAERAAATAVLARLVYWSGVVLVMSFGNVIATGIMGWGALGSSVFGLLVLVFGALGAGLGGVLDDRLGTRNALSLMLIGLGASLGLILTMSPDRLFALIAVTPRAEGARDLASLAEWVVLGLGALTGVFLGTTGPMSRSLVARYSPPDRTARYYGLAALAGNVTNVVGPLFVALVTRWTDSQRAGLLVAPVFLLLGILILRRLPKQGYRTADVG
jgi:UMF1 family MFS transporter